MIPQQNLKTADIVVDVPVVWKEEGNDPIMGNLNKIDIWTSPIAKVWMPWRLLYQQFLNFAVGSG